MVGLLVAAMLGLSVHQAPAAQAAVATKIVPPAAAVGTAITVVGDGLDAVTDVTFLGAGGAGDEVAAQYFLAPDPKKIVVQVPVGAVSGPLELTTPDGAVTTGLVEFTVYAPPAITVLSATSGPAGADVTISGTNLLGAKKPVVAFGSKKTGALTGSTQTDVLVKVPAGLPGGPVQVSLTTTGGTVHSNFIIGPDVKSVAPISGTTAGGTVVSIKGTGFTGVTSFTDDPATAGVNEKFDGVTFGGNRVTKLIAISDKELVVQTPPGTDGLADVLVKTKHDATVATSGNLVKFAYQPLPVVTSLSKNWNAVGNPTPVVRSSTGCRAGRGIARTWRGTARGSAGPTGARGRAASPCTSPASTRPGPTATSTSPPTRAARASSSRCRRRPRASDG
jgi:hypothetical protein